MEFVEIESTAPPSLLERLQRDVKADRIAESETVRDRTSEAVDAHGVPFESMSFNSRIEHRRRHLNDLDWWKAQARHARAARDRDPHLMRQLCSDVMEAQGREKTDNRRWHSGSGKNHRMVFGGFSIDRAISTGADPLEFTGSSHPRERRGMDAECLRITRPDESGFTRKLEEPRAAFAVVWYSASRHL